MAEINIEIGNGDYLIYEDHLDKDGELELIIYDSTVWINKKGAEELIKILKKMFNLDNLPLGQKQEKPFRWLISDGIHPCKVHLK
jgi:hypothetical protein